MLSLRLVRTLLLLLAVTSLAALPFAVVEPRRLTWTLLDLGPLGQAELGVSLGTVPAFLLLLVTGIGAVVAAYAARNLTGQHRLHRFAGLQLLAVLALASAVVAPGLPQLALGWTVGGLAVAGLVAHAGTSSARASRRVMVTRLLVGDASLWAVVVLAGTQLGTLALDRLNTTVADAPATTVGLMALLVVAAGVSRSALVPLHRWLPETAEAPSPVSALLHAGLVNGVGVLALLLWPLMAASVPARGVLLVLATATAVLGTAQVRTRPDVKGRLAASTTAQMGYLGVQVALGLPAAVLAHLVGHGMWKASHFLGAGGAVERARAAVRPAAAGTRRRPVPALAVAVLVVAAASVAPGPWGVPLATGPAALLPALLAVVALTAALLGGSRIRTRAHAVAVVASVLAVVLYLLALRALTTLTDSVLTPATPSWGEPGTVAVLVLVLLLVAVGAGFWWLDRLARAGRLRRVVARVAATSLPPTRLTMTRGRRPTVAHEVMASAHREPDAAEVDHARTVLQVAGDLIAPLWPLESFVASNPLASLETLEFHDALQVGALTRGSSVGPSAEMFRRAWTAGRVDDSAIAQAASALLDDRSPLVAGVRRLDIVRETLMTDAATPPRAASAASAYLGLTFGRVYGATAWGSEPGGAWASLRADAGLDRALGTRGARELARALPADPERAVALLLPLVDARTAQHARIVGDLLTSYAGWAAHVSWRLRQGAAVPSLEGTAGGADQLRARALADLVAPLLFDLVVRGGVTQPGDDVTRATESSTNEAAAPAAVAAALGARGPAVAEVAAVVTEVRRYGAERLRLDAWERAVRAPIMTVIASRARDLGGVGMLGSARSAEAGPDAQVITCIDVRSERLRRRLEELGPSETFGAAGFFGLPLRHVSPTGAVTERCPVLVRPERAVTEQARSERWSWTTTVGAEALHGVESRPFTPYALAEASGWLLGPLAGLRTAAPGWWVRVGARLRRVAGAPSRGSLSVLASDASSAHEGFTVEELADLAEAFLRSTGLVDLAPLVVLCGHGGTAANNPHLAAYDCGACGGQPGDVSARAMVQVLSDPGVGARLAQRGLDLSGTTFVAAFHDTTRDRVTLLDGAVEPSTALARLVADLAAATDRVALERRPMLPQTPRGGGVRRVRRHLERRAGDWAQVRPEWGLAGNAALVIGPRSLTQGIDLAGRVFLQSYRPDIDPDGEVLTSLMAGPLVVGQWISMQYWCSTIDPERFGAGDKTTHNVVVAADGADHALSGVLTGARGDLRIGLPWQAVSATAPVEGDWRGLPQHDPVRLLVVVCARPAVIDDVLSRLPDVARLVLGGWVSLRAVDPSSGDVVRLEPHGGWVTECDAAARDLADPVV